MQISPDVKFHDDGSTSLDWARVRESFGDRWCLFRKLWAGLHGAILEKTEDDDLRVRLTGHGVHADDADSERGAPRVIWLMYVSVR